MISEVGSGKGCPPPTMNGKILLITLVALGGAGYYAYDSGLLMADKPAPKASPAKARKPASKAPKAKADTPKPKAPEAAPAKAAPAKNATQGKQTAAPAGSARVADVLATLPLVKDVTPNTKARYFIYLMSAGWCGPCNAEMPHIVKAYEEMKREGVAELILVDFDGKPEQARAYMDKYGAAFPAVMESAAPVLPGILPPQGIPSAIIVDEMGNMVKRGHGSITTQWRRHIAEYEQQKGLPPSLPQK